MANSTHHFKTVRLTVPVQEQALRGLSIGTIVYLDGVIYTAREGVYQRVIGEGHPLPPGLSSLSNVNFHCSPAAAVEPDGRFKVGGVTATASFRFAQWMVEWFRVSGARIVIGKGGMSGQDYRDLFLPAGAIYLTTVGYGTGALLGRGIRGVLEVHWLEELGNAQAMWVFEVENFGPFIVDSDLAGNSLFEQQAAEVNQNLEQLYAGLTPPALSRYGETDDRKDELI